MSQQGDNARFDLSEMGINDTTPNDADVVQIPDADSPFVQDVVAALREREASSGFFAEDSNPPPPDDEDEGEGAGSEESSPETEEPSPSPEVPGQAPEGDVADYVVTVNGQHYGVTQAQMEQLLGLDAWARGLPDQLKYAFGEIEQGRAVAITRADYDELQRLRTQPASADTRPSYDAEDLDPQAAAYIHQLEQDNAQLRSRPDPNVEAQVRAQHALQAQVATEAASAWQQEHHFTDDQMQQLAEWTVRLNVIPGIVQTQQTYDSLGHLIRDADYPSVYATALTVAANAHPQLSSLMTDPRVEQRLVAERDQARRTDMKKARAASLATAPSAAVTPPRDPSRPMTFSEMEAPIAAVLREAMSRT